MEILHDIERAKDKMLEAVANLQKNVAIHQGTEKMPTPYIVLYIQKKASIVQTSPKVFNRSFCVCVR